MAFQSAPAELRAVPTTEGVKMALLPYMPKFAKPIAVRSGTTGGGGLGLGQILAPVLPGSVVLAIVLLVLVLGGIWVGLGIRRESRKKRTTLELRVEGRELELRWLVDDEIERTERVALRQIGRVDVVEAGYQRPHVVANVVGRDPLVLPMERNTDEAARWLAQELAKAAQEAR